MPKDRLNISLRSIQKDVQSVEAILQGILSRMDEPVRSMLKTSLRGGKKLRPAMVILCGRLCNIPRKKTHVLAAAVEVLHSATLIHDDLVDNAFLRRGRKTIQATWPVGATVLAGDYLLAQSVCLVSQLQDPGVLRILAETLHKMSAGEIYYHYSLQNRKSRDVYFESIDAKTASLFRGAMEMIGVAAAREKTMLKHMSDFGHEFGITYQIVDDVLDFISDEKKLGKPAGSDLSQGTITLPVICHLERGHDDRIINKILSGNATPRDMKAMIQLIRQSGAIDDALDEARVHARKCKAALARLPAGKPRKILHELVDYIVERKY